jgi:hypothetical protein
MGLLSGGGQPGGTFGVRTALPHREQYWQVSLNSNPHFVQNMFTLLVENTQAGVKMFREARRHPLAG